METGLEPIWMAEFGPQPIHKLFNFTWKHWIDTFSKSAMQSFDEELELYELLDLDAAAELLKSTIWPSLIHVDCHITIDLNNTGVTDWTLGQNSTVAEIPFHIKNPCWFSNSVNWDYKLDSHDKWNKLSADILIRESRDERVSST